MLFFTKYNLEYGTIIVYCRMIGGDCHMMLFSLLHWPCATTLLTIKKETNSIKWTALGFLIPTAIAFIVCFLTTIIYNIFA